MILENQSPSKQSKNISISVVLYVIAAIVAISGIILLVDNIYLFRNTLNEYATKKIPMKAVLNQLILVKLLPGIFEPIGLYGGIASILLAIGMTNKRISKGSALLTKTSVSDEKGTLEENIYNIENEETTK